MSIQIHCSQCGQKRRVNERLAGRTIRCPGCEQPITIPEPAPQSDAVAADVAAARASDARASDSRASAGGVAMPLAAGGNDAGGNGDGHGAALTGTGLLAAVPVPSAIPSNPVHPTLELAPAALADDDEDDTGVPPRKKREDGELDMTPMVDVTFLLLIFFMVTASFSLQKSVQMPRQQSDLPSVSNVEEETDELDPVELEIDENGGFLVMAKDWERETPGKQNLITALEEAIGENRDGMQLNIKVHENAKLQFLVDGMDAGTIAGFTALQVTEVDGFN